MTAQRSDGSESQDTVIALIQRDVSDIKEQVGKIVTDLESKYATKVHVESELRLINQQLSPLQKIIYGMIGVILMAVLSGLVLLVIK